jgi:hypothetical protein
MPNDIQPYDVEVNTAGFEEGVLEALMITLDLTQDARVAQVEYECPPDGNIVVQARSRQRQHLEAASVLTRWQDSRPPLKPPPPRGETKRFRGITAKSDVTLVLRHCARAEHHWNTAFMIHPRLAEGPSFRTQKVDLSKCDLNWGRQRQGQYCLREQDTLVRDAMIRITGEVVISALGPSATRTVDTDGGLVHWKTDGGRRYTQSVSMLGVAPGTPGQRYHIDGPTLVLRDGKVCRPVYYNVMVPLSDNCTPTEYIDSGRTHVHTPQPLTPGVYYYTFDGLQWHRGARNDTGRWQYKMFVNLVQEELRGAVVYPVFLDTCAGYTDTILELIG